MVANHGGILIQQTINKNNPKQAQINPRANTAMGIQHGIPIQSPDDINQKYQMTNAPSS